jgi:3-oxoadipate enol-lactonase
VGPDGPSGPGPKLGAIIEPETWDALVPTVGAEEIPPEVPGLPPEVPGLPVPIGRRVPLRGRGTTFVREVPGPPGATTVLLLHGWMASGGLNWFQVFQPLSEHFRVVAPDLRGHGRGIRSRRRFRLADCADDVAALLEEIGEDEPVIAVGYSMGGPVAQLLWKRHPHRVRGLVLCASGPSFVPAARERIIFTTFMSAAAGVSGAAGLATNLPTRLTRRMMPAGNGERARTMRAWATAEMRRHDWRQVLEAGHAIGTFDSRRWVKRIDVPTDVLVTEHDRALPAKDQRRFAASIPGATVHTIDGGHTMCMRPEFGPPVVAACRRVERRSS